MKEFQKLKELNELEVVKEVGKILEEMTTLEMSTVLDEIIQTRIVGFDSAFEEDYQQVLERIRKFSALKTLRNYLLECKNIVETYEANLKKYQLGLKYRDIILEEYVSWKKSAECAHYVCDFYMDRAIKIEEKYPELRGYLTMKYVGELIRDARKSQKDATYRTLEPERPQFDREKLSVENALDTFPQTQTSAELLAILGKNDLEWLSYQIMETLGDKNTDRIRAFLEFRVCHALNCNTKGKGYDRTDKQDEKDPSKTSGITNKKLYAECKESIKILEKYC